MTDDDLRARLDELARELAVLPDDAFAEKFRLQSEADRLRAALQAASADEASEASARWADRAGRKGSHAEDPEVMKSRIASPSEAGYMGG